MIFYSHTFKILSFALALCLSAFSVLAAPAREAPSSSEWNGIDKAQVRLISSLTTVNGHDKHLFGLEFQMEKGWKVYWRSPGDAGYPPSLTWHQTSNLENATLQWPRPERFEVLGLETLGYKDHVIYPLAVTLQDPSKAFRGDVDVRFLTCDDICIPVTASLSFDLPAGNGTLSAHARAINDFQGRVPAPAAARDVTVLSHTIAPHADEKQADFQVTVTVSAPWQWNAPEVLFEGPQELLFDTPVLKRNVEGTHLWIEGTTEGIHYLSHPVEDSAFTFTILDGDKAIEVRSQAQAAAYPLPQNTDFIALNAPETEPSSFWLMIGFALFGGFILNFMPCVLPVLSLKIFSLIHHRDEPQAITRRRFLVTTAGILTSFLGLASGLFLLQSAGVAIGWGMQFQQPLFLIFLALITTAFACNMWGVFDLQLPRFLQDKIGTSASSGYSNDFATGAFATLLATPCSAPFLGTAIGFAFTQGPLALFTLFTAMGVGLSLPYLLLALYPKAGHWFPKPGKWMHVLKAILGVCLLATTAWLLSILPQQIGTLATQSVAGLILLFLLSFLFKSRLRKAHLPIVSLLIVSSFTVVPALGQKPDPDAAFAAAEQLWLPFDPEDLQARIQRGDVILVDVTADWCITCQVNKRLVTYQGDVFDQLEKGHVTAIKADWTRPDSRIATYLAHYNRFAIPFNVVYGPNAPKGIILPEILREKDVLNAFLRAKD